MSEIFGIDVSRYQGEINWQKVKAAGVRFAMIRVGWAGWEGDISVDANFKKNVEGAIAAGVNAGVYVFAYCKTVGAAVIAARQTLALIRPYKITYPVAFDMETEAETPYQNYTRAQNSAIAGAFLAEIANAKYCAVVYSYKAFLESLLDMNALKAYDVWVAQTGSRCTYTGAYSMWQYSWVGKIDGISVACDLDYAYKDYAANNCGSGSGETPESGSTAALSAENAKLKTELSAATGKLEDIRGIVSV